MAALAALIFSGLIITRPVPDPAGDIPEYFGITETVLRHGSVALTPDDRRYLSSVLHPEYFSNPGYYVTGLGGQRYPVHFIGYSLLIVPVRVLLELAGLSPLYVFGIGNTMILFFILIYILKYFFSHDARGAALVAMVLASPLMFFLNWPGPDMLVMALVLLGFFFWHEEKPLPAAAVFALASWHSQPVIVLSAAALAYRFLTEIKRDRTGRPYRFSLAVLSLASVPYLYNLTVFGAWTPWTGLADGWTRLYGFGIRNLSLTKLAEQFLDLNTGIFWYAPLLTVFACAAVITYRYTSRWVWMAAGMLITLFTFQTNPAWHYGTAGYGPSRHALILVPFFLSAVTVWLPKKRSTLLLVSAILIFQLPSLVANNYIFPIFSNTLVHTPLARLVLERYPAIYNPTPEIFTDRTNHSDPDHPVSAVFRTRTACRKAYVLTADIDRVIGECGPFPPGTNGSVIRPETDGFYVTYE